MGRDFDYAATDRRIPHLRLNEGNLVQLGHGRVLAQAVDQALADARLDAVLEVEDHLHLAREALDHAAQVGGHGQERAQHEQAGGDGRHRERVHQAAAPEALQGLFDEVRGGAEQVVEGVPHDLSTVALSALASIDFALSQVSDSRATLGANGNRFQSAIANIQSFSESLSAANSRIKDVDVAEETSRMSRSQILLQAGVTHVVGCDSKGIVHEGREDLNPAKRWFAENTNPEGRTGDLAEAVRGADLFLGLSAPNVLSVDDLKTMNDDPIVFAMANPDPEIRPEVAMGHARIIATGRSDYPNQINNVLCFPGIFRGALDVRAREIDEEMKLAAANAMADVIPEEDLSEDYIIPSVFDERVAPAVAEAVAERAKETGMARRIQDRAETGLSATTF